MEILHLLFMELLCLSGTNMNLLTSFNVPESNGCFSLAGTNFCIKPTGIVISNGTLYLPNDRDFILEQERIIGTLN